MDPQTQVKVFNEALGVKGTKGKLLQIHEEGYYEVVLEVNQKPHKALLPIHGTVLLAADPMVETESVPVERY